jgi:Protein of unknown function (DUF2630)
MDDHQILGQVRELIDEEHRLRELTQRGELPAEDEQVQMRRLEEALDQCWDLLRQRRARLDAGQDPDTARPRPVSEVENYRQ